MTGFTRKCSKCSAEYKNGNVSENGKRFCHACGGTLSEPSLELKVTIKIKLDEEAIDAIMCAALEGGVTYWCREAKVVGGYLGEYAHEQIARGGKLVLVEDENDGLRHTLTLNKLGKGFSMYVAAGYATDIISDGEIDVCAIDAEVADGIVQYAIFGEIVYG